MPGIAAGMLTHHAFGANYSLIGNFCILSHFGGTVKSVMLFVYPSKVLALLFNLKKGQPARWPTAQNPNTLCGPENVVFDII